VAEAVVDLAGDDIEGVVLRLDAVSLSGRVTFNDGPPASNAPAARVDLRRADTGVLVPSFDRASVVAGPDGRFRLDGLLPGRYDLTCTVASPAGQLWWPESAPADGGDALDSGVVIGPAASDLVVRLTDRPARIGGLVEYHDGRPAAEFSVVAFPVEESLRGPRSRWVRLVPVAADGTFELIGLAPGEYFVNAAGTSNPRELGVELFGQLQPGAHRLTLSPGQHASLRLKLPASVRLAAR
jgi:hypothetical protein